MNINENAWIEQLEIMGDMYEEVMDEREWEDDELLASCLELGDGEEWLPPRLRFPRRDRMTDEEEEEERTLKFPKNFPWS
tara:strand:+ start:85 stop:324 length:240 start_codon:yes stop_codon:yes gene_type:complete